MQNIVNLFNAVVTQAVFPNMNAGTVTDLINKARADITDIALKSSEDVAATETIAEKNPAEA